MKITTAKVLKKGINAHLRGNLTEAETFYKLILQSNPNHPDANHNMGVLLCSLGKIEEAVDYFKTALNENSSVQEFWTSYINALHSLGKTEEANVAISLSKQKKLAQKSIKHLHIFDTDLKDANSNENPPQDIVNNLKEKYKNNDLNELENQAKKLLLQFPKSAIIFNILGAFYIKTEQYDKGIETFHLALKYQPNNAGILNNLGVTLQRLRKTHEAISIFLKALKIEPNLPEVYNNLGIGYKTLGQISKAQSYFKTAIIKNPVYAEALNNLGNTFALQKNWVSAIKSYEQAIQIDQKYAEAMNNLGIAHRKIGNLENALEFTKRALDLLPKYPEALNNMGNVFLEEKNIDMAISFYRKALIHAPRTAEIHNNLGVSFSIKGNFILAQEYYETALEIDPNYTEAHRNISKLIKYSPDHPQIRKIEQLLNDKSLQSSDRSQLHHTYAKIQDDLGNSDVAFKHFQQAGQLRKIEINYNIEKDELLFKNIKETAHLINKHSINPPTNNSQLIPIFVIGMPRSGTTLIEQILSSHSKIYGAGELTLLSKLGLSIATGLETISKDKLTTIRDTYLLKLAEITDDRKFVIDKLPHNFLLVGLIKNIFPEAKIIHTMRSPQANCWSLYKHFFPALGSYDFTNTISDISEYFALYQSLMDFWTSLYSEPFYELNYESLTNNPSIEIEKLLNFLDLSLEDSCLSPEKNYREVHTASQQQIRNPIYINSSLEWKKYENLLSGAFDHL